jgi:hypothetical protein
MARFVLTNMPDRSVRLRFEKGAVMPENKKKWMDLCEQAADEEDPKKLAALILQINFILEAKELRLKGDVAIPTTVEDDIANLSL